MKFNEYLNNLTEAKSIETSLRHKFPEVRLVMTEEPNYVIIKTFLIQAKRRGHGEAAAFMKYLVKICKNNKDIYLSASDVYGADIDELKKFYSSLGFVKNTNSKIKEDLVLHS